ncbi:4Fe-4S dicluster domain-containing protein [Selenihalanaerobacter shriftii]|uniref:Heterodisulfide reductase subunit C n=1 Tax=Selenihalanaerobacter shriftii TaxID=142842 RepID=A0A1T4K9J6_9FIRM|nr:4Fe-4S dicluster domain-containing protein [Selenihalanaerobacter shriftii]SJZ38985.1 heterodisulfide reductase subunit C [Selenihalanaerobacter shriftii]
MLYKLDTDTMNNNLLKRVEEGSNSTLRNCLQCYKCGGMCQESDRFDYTPRQIIEQIIDGLEDKVLNSRAIWMCGTCDKCEVKCPSGINMKKIMQVLRKMAREKGVEPNTSRINRRFEKKAHCPKRKNDQDQ